MVDRCDNFVLSTLVMVVIMVIVDVIIVIYVDVGVLSLVGRVSGASTD